jgi:hypothetical protein
MDFLLSEKLCINHFKQQQQQQKKKKKKKRAVIGEVLGLNFVCN